MIRGVLIRFCGALALWFTLDALAFRTGWYASILKPDSTAGFFETRLYGERHRTVGNPNQVLAVGDSRIPLRARIANSITSETGYTFATIATPGTNPRCWYYMLRDVDPSANRYAAVVIPADTYDDRAYDDYAASEIDIRYLVPVLRIGDIFDFAFSFPAWPERGQALATGLLKGLAYQQDFQDFVVNHRKRLEDVRRVREQAFQWTYNAAWDDLSLAGMTVDWDTHAIHLPGWLNPGVREDSERLLMRDPAPRSADLAAYRGKWFGRIVAHYRGSRTLLIFVRLPRGPVVRPNLPADRDSTIRDLASRGEVALVAEHFFDGLERPELFGDALHMNGPGGEKFSLSLAREASRMLRERQTAGTAH